MAHDSGMGIDKVRIAVAAPPLREHGTWRGVFTLEKFERPIEFYARRAARQVGSQDELAQTLRALARGRGRFDLVPPRIQLIANERLRVEHPAYEVATFENGLLNAGITSLLTILSGGESGANSGGGSAGANALFNNAQARLGVGDSSTAFSASQTDLQAVTNKYYQGMDATYPQVSAQTITFKVTITGSNADFAWNEFVADNCNGSNSTSTTRSGGASLNRAVSSQGTKVSGQSWALTLTVTIS